MTFKMFGYNVEMNKRVSKTRKDGRYDTYISKGNKIIFLGGFDSKKEVVEHMRLNRYNLA